MMQYTPSDILNYVYEKELDTQFLLAMANHVQDFSIGEITDKKIEKRGEDFYLISGAYHLDIKITDDEVMDCISVHLFQGKMTITVYIFWCINILTR